MHRPYVSAIPYYRTKPINADSRERESLCSILVRMSRDHLLPVALLLEQEFGISFNHSAVNKAAKTLLFPDEKLSFRIYRFFEKTLFTEHVWFRFTFSGMSERLDLTSSLPLKPSKAWCPLCYSEDSRRSVCYDRLYWSFSEVNHCYKHHVSLASICYYCGAKQNELHVNYAIGCCDHCGRFLGLEHYYVEPEFLPRFPRYDEFLKHCLSDSRMVVALAIGYADKMRSIDGSTRELAEVLSVEYGYLAAVLSYDRKPSFAFCLKVMEVYDAWVQRRGMPFAQETDAPAFDHDPVGECIDSTTVKNHLNRIIEGDLPVNTRDSISKTLGVTNGYLVTHFQQEAAEITRMLQSVSQSNRPDDAMKQQLRVALAQIKHEGHQVKWETIVANLPDEILKNARARDIYAALRHVERKTVPKAARRSIKRRKS